MPNLTPEQINKIIERQVYIENYILGSDFESKDYVLWCCGLTESQFYKKYLWEFLGLGELATDESSEVLIGLSEEEKLRIFGEAKKET
jgi:hypothetical protein